MSVLAGCGGGGGGIGPKPPSIETRQVTLLEYGRLVDVYGLEATSAGDSIVLFRRDALIGREVRDGRVVGTSTEDLPDALVDYDFFGSDPDTLQPRVLIPRTIGSAEFGRLFDALDDSTGSITPRRFGPLAPGQTFSVVPRNAALRVHFSGRVGVGDEFFHVRDADGRVIGLRNTEAVQLLQIAGDPELPDSFVPLPVRVIVGETTVTLDPVLLGSEGQQYEARNNAAGLPASPDSFGANIRVAIALDGPLALPAMRGDAFTGRNNAGRPAIVRDFRSGNETDSGGSNLSRGFVLDEEPPHLLGELPMYLERVTSIDARTDEVLLWKDGVVHELDRGDRVRFVVGSASDAFGASEVVVDPRDDRGIPEVQRVRVRIRGIQGLAGLDPSRRPDYPGDPEQRDAWLRAHAPRAIVTAEYQGGGVDARGVARAPDDGRYFGMFRPTPQPLADGSPSQPNENVSPFAGAVLRFSKPVDLATVKGADTLFFATRDLIDRAAIDEFIATRPWSMPEAPGAPSGVGMNPASFREAKFRTPHLIASRVLDEDGSQTTVRLQPLSGFYLDASMRSTPRQYFLHVLAGVGGIRDLAGNPLDLQTTVASQSRGLVIPFSLDTRAEAGRPRFEDNLAVYVVRRFADADEDENPSLYLPAEVQGSFGVNAAALELRDLFGSYSALDGRIVARPTTRVRKATDDRNQAPFDPQESLLRWCPRTVAGGAQLAGNTASAPIGNGVQNPLNPFGCRLQTVWREIDLSLSRTDPEDFNLDVEQMYWAPVVGGDILFDEFDRTRLILGHSERRPEPCINAGSALASLPLSGLGVVFEDNYVRNLRPDGSIESRPAAHLAFATNPSPWRIDPTAAFLEPTGAYRYLPMPAFGRPYFVYRDETVVEQGGECGVPGDVAGGSSVQPWIVSPWNMGIGRKNVQDDAGARSFVGFWNSGNGMELAGVGGRDQRTEGLLGSIALPLLADWLVECDSSALPAGNGYLAQGFNGWQTSVTLQSGAQPNFRTYTAGRPAYDDNPRCREPGSGAQAIGGFSPPIPIGTGGATIPGDNTFYWTMVDFLKRASVVTSGFVDLYDPHRVGAGMGDPRLGPYMLTALGQVALPAGVRPKLLYDFDPPLTTLPGGTRVVPQFRGATAVEARPWYWEQWGGAAGTLYPGAFNQRLKPTAVNFPLDPGKACDAHIRKYDARTIDGVTRNWWTYPYNRVVTSYVADPNELLQVDYLRGFGGPTGTLVPADVRYVNWRFLMSNNVDSSPPVSPSIDTFVLAWRFER